MLVYSITEISIVRPVHTSISAIIPKFRIDFMLNLPWIGAPGVFCNRLPFAINMIRRINPIIANPY